MRFKHQIEVAYLGPVSGARDRIRDRVVHNNAVEVVVILRRSELRLHTFSIGGLVLCAQAMDVLFDQVVCTMPRLRRLVVDHRIGELLEVA